MSEMLEGGESDAGIVASDFRIEVRNHSNDFRLYHDPCGMTLIVTQSVTLLTLVRRAGEHTCVRPPRVTSKQLAHRCIAAPAERENR